MIIREIIQPKDWTTLEQRVASEGVYEVDLVKHVISPEHVEIYARIFTQAHKQKSEKKLFSGHPSAINLDDLRDAAKKFLKDRS